MAQQKVLVADNEKINHKNFKGKKFELGETNNAYYYKN